MMKFFLGIALLTMSGQVAWGFALLGPAPITPAGYLNQSLPSTFGDNWQVNSLGYGLAYENYTIPGGPVWLGDIGGPKNIGEEYRRNVPVFYYAYDANFAGFFGAQGETAVDQAFAIMNGLTNVDLYSADLVEFPFNSQHFNSKAENLYLTDIKSVTLHLLVEQLGLAEPERYTWTLHDRYIVSPPGCPLGALYIVVQRNLGTTDLPLTAPNTGTQYSPYVNNVLYTYGIAEDCARHPPIWDAITIAFSVDPTAVEYTSVAANDFEGGAETGLGGLGIGGFYTGLTRDDVAGLRYLMRTNNMNWETAGGGSSLQQTNLSTQVALYTTDLGALLMSAQTNDPLTVAALFPGVVVAGSSNYLTVVTNPIIVSYFTNKPGDPIGTPPQLVVKTNGYTYTPMTRYVTKFANVVITTNWFANSYRTNTSAKFMTVSVGHNPGDPIGSPLKTNVTFKTITLTNVPSGDYYLIPPGTCGFSIPNPQPSAGFPIETVTATTNIITEAFNSQGYYYSQSIVTYATNHIFQAYACELVAGATGNYQGIQRVQFVRIPDVGVDPLTGNLLQPFWVTNYYTMVFFNPTNSQLYTRTFQRVVTTPDILLTASDQALGPGNVPFNGTVIRDIHFTVANILPGLAGPGTIDGPVTFDYNKVGTAFWNGPFPSTNSFLIGEDSLVNETTHIPSLLWASYDGSTNDPVVYPTSLSIQQLENQMVITISPPSLPDGTNDLSYSVTFAVTGGQPPYTWSLASDSQPLPGGLGLSADGILSGTLTGNPVGTYDFTIQLNDSAARSVQRACSINIH